MKDFGYLQSFPYQLDFRARRQNAGFRLLLEDVKNIDRFLKSDGINRTISVAVEVRDYFHNSRASEAAHRLGIGMLSALLRYPKGVTDFRSHLRWESLQISAAAPNPNNILRLRFARHAPTYYAFLDMPQRQAAMQRIGSCGGRAPSIVTIL